MNRSVLPNNNNNNNWAKVERIGEQLRQRLRETAVEAAWWSDTELTPFWLALRDAAAGDFQRLADYRRTGGKKEPPPVLSEDEAVEQFLRQRYERMKRQYEPPASKPKRRGRPANNGARATAEAALEFYRLWKQRNRDLGINDWRLSDEMKEVALHIVIADYFPSQLGQWAKLRGRMERSEVCRALP